MVGNGRKPLANPLSIVNSGMGEFAEKLNQSRELDRKRLQAEVHRLGGPVEFLRAKYPLLARTAPDALSEVALSRTTLVDLSDAERRLHGCAKCPQEGGICATDHAGHKPGTVPDLKTGQLVFSGCDKWAEYEIRSRMVIGGVPKRYAGIAISYLWESLSKESQSVLKAFSKAFRSGTFCSLMVTGSQSSLVCVAVLRSLVMTNQSLSFKSVRVPELARDLKVHFSGGDDPLEELSDLDILVLSDMHLETAQPWLREQLIEITKSRFLAEKVTIVGTLAGDPMVDAAALGFDSTVQFCVAEFKTAE